MRYSGFHLSPAVGTSKHLSSSGCLADEEICCRGEEDPKLFLWLFQIHWVTADTVKGMLIYLWTSLVSLGYFPALNFRGWHILDSCYGGLGLITIQLLGALLSENPANKQWNTLDLGLNCFLGPKLPKHEYKNYMKSELTNRAIR